MTRRANQFTAGEDGPRDSAGSERPVLGDPMMKSIDQGRPSALAVRATGTAVLLSVMICIDGIYAQASHARAELFLLVIPAVANAIGFGTIFKLWVSPL